MAVTENSAPCTPRTEYFLRFHLTLIPSPQIPLAKAQSEALGCRTFSMEGYEADDVMATLARNLRPTSHPTSDSLNQCAW